MREYLFLLIHIFTLKDRIDYALIRKNAGQWKPVFLHFYVVKAIRKTSKKNFVFYPTLLPFLLMKYFEVLSCHPDIFLDFQTLPSSHSHCHLFVNTNTALRFNFLDIKGSFLESIRFKKYAQQGI